MQKRMRRGAAKFVVSWGESSYLRYILGKSWDGVEQELLQLDSIPSLMMVNPGGYEEKEDNFRK
jgi:hypothetical protein